MMVWEVLLELQKWKEELVLKLFVWDAVLVVLGQSPSNDAVWQ
jgi:hypothetical protein